MIEYISPGSTNVALTFNIPNKIDATISKYKIATIRKNFDDPTSISVSLPVALTELTNIDDAYSANKGKFYSTDSSSGNILHLRADFDNLAFATGADEVICNVYDEDNNIIASRIFSLEIKLDNYIGFVHYNENATANVKTRINYDGVPYRTVTNLTAFVALIGSTGLPGKIFGNLALNVPITNKELVGGDGDAKITGSSGLVLANTILRELIISGYFLGTFDTMFYNCILDGITKSGANALQGTIHNSVFKNTNALASNPAIDIHNCHFEDSTLDIGGGSTATINLSNVSGKINLEDLTDGGATVSIHVKTGTTIVQNVSCTNGAIKLKGIGNYIKNGAVVADLSEWTELATLNAIGAPYDLTDGSTLTDLTSMLSQMAEKVNKSGTFNLATDSLEAQAEVGNNTAAWAQSLEYGLIKNSGTIPSSSNNTAKLGAGLTGAGNDDVYKGCLLTTTVAGATPGQTRLITAYDGATQIATVYPDWTMNPPTPNGSVASYKVLANGLIDVHSLDAVAQGEINALLAPLATEANATANTASIIAAVGALNNISPAEVLAQVNAAWDASNTIQPIPNAETGSLRAWVQMIALVAKSKKVETDTLQQIFREDETTEYGTRSITANPSDVTLGELN